MICDKVIEGRYVDLKSCTEDDAEFTLAIRKDPKFTKFLPEINNTIEQQKAWIRYQRQKDGDYFFVVWDKQGNRIGTISIYNVNGDHAESGRLVIKGKIPFQAIEAQILVYRFAYDELGLSYVDGYIFSDNLRAIQYSKSFGDIHFAPTISEEGVEIIKIRNCKDNFKKVDKKFSSILYR